MARRQWKKNKMKVDLNSYMHYIRGIKKIGKTTLFYDIIKAKYNGDLDKGLLISIGNEDGYKALDDLNFVDAQTFEELEKIVDDVVRYHNEDGIEMVCLDTADEVIRLAIEKVKDDSTKETKKVCKSLNSAFGGLI